jgi:hypothetical protein
VEKWTIDRCETQGELERDEDGERRDRRQQDLRNQSASRHRRFDLQQSTLGELRSGTSR